MMDKLIIGRYTSEVSGYAGWIEGTRDDGSTWILFVDESGSPAEYFGKRDESGAVIGDAVLLQ